MVRYWEWIKKRLFAWRSNKAFNKANRIKSYSDAYILVTENIAVTRTIATAGNDPVKTNQPLTAATQVAFKNSAPFKGYRTKVNDTFFDFTDFINIAMPMYNLIEYSDNYTR